MDVTVDCYSGYRGEEIQLDERQVEVVEVIDRWLGPDHRYFKARGDDGAVYLLRHEEWADRWELKMMSGTKHPELRRSGIEKFES